MTYEARLKEFYSQFGLDAYPVSAVPDKAALPYITYEVAYGNYENVAATVNVYYHTESESVPNRKAQEIKDAIGSGITLSFDEGIVTIYKGTPEQINTSFQDEPDTKLRTLNVIYAICRNKL